MLADLAALARERSELLRGRGAARAREELLLKRAAEDAAGVAGDARGRAQVVAHALRAGRRRPCVLTRMARADGGAPPAPGGIPAAVAEVARSHASRRSSGLRDARAGGAGPAAVRRALGGARIPASRSTRDEVELLGRLARMLRRRHGQRRRLRPRAADARGRSRAASCPTSLPDLPGFELGLLYEPAAHQPAGGDVYGAWELPGGEVAVLVGDVAGKGVETAALSAMARFFIEARSWDCTDPARDARAGQHDAPHRLPSDTFVTAFLGLLPLDGLRYANAGHLPRRWSCAAGGEPGEAQRARACRSGSSRRPALRGATLALGPGDLLLGLHRRPGRGAPRRASCSATQRLREAAAERLPEATHGTELRDRAVHQRGQAAAARRRCQDDAVLLPRSGSRRCLNGPRGRLRIRARRGGHRPGRARRGGAGGRAAARSTRAARRARLLGLGPLRQRAAARRRPRAWRCPPTGWARS